MIVWGMSFNDTQVEFAASSTHSSTRCLYRPRREDRSWADKVWIERAASSHQTVCAHFTFLGIPPVPVWDGEVGISGQLPNLILPVEEVNAVPRQKSRRFMSKVNVCPNVPWTSQERIPRHVIVHPNKQVVGVDVREHGPLPVLPHLCSCGCRDHVVGTSGVLGQVEVRDEFLLLGHRQREDVPPHWLSVFSTVWTPVTKLTFATVKASIVSSTTAGPVKES